MANPTVSDSELAIMKVLWGRGPSTVRHILSGLRGKRRQWAYTTVLTLLQRLRHKRLVSSDSAGVAHVYAATATREDLLNNNLTELANRLGDGTVSPLVRALVSKDGLSREEIAGFRKLLDELEQNNSKRKAK